MEKIPLVRIFRIKVKPDDNAYAIRLNLLPGKEDVDMIKIERVCPSKT